MNVIELLRAAIATRWHSGNKPRQAYIYQVPSHKDYARSREESWRSEQLQPLCRARILTSHFMRLRGLLGTKSCAMPVVLEHCASIHTFGMRYPIDVAFIGKNGIVLLAKKHVLPGHVLSARGARRVLERPACAEWWPQRGECLCARLISRDAVYRYHNKQGGDYDGTRRTAA